MAMWEGCLNGDLQVRDKTFMLCFLNMKVETKILVFSPVKA
jgi:hypothetical protein